MHIVPHPPHIIHYTNMIVHGERMSENKNINVELNIWVNILSYHVAYFKSCRAYFVDSLWIKYIAVIFHRLTHDRFDRSFIIDIDVLRALSYDIKPRYIESLQYMNIQPVV